MGITVSALKGYLLEEALARLIHNSGYSLLTDASVCDDLIDDKKNGLNVIGRGGLHQADVLGEFPFSYPFTYPIRLFVEAKFRSRRTGIEVIRKGIGITHDLNQNYQTALETDEMKLLVQRYNYNYAVFSTSGFSPYAINLAIAHKIHLIDLSGEEYADLRGEIHQRAQNLHDLYKGDIPANVVKNFRVSVRNELFDLKYDKSKYLDDLPGAVLEEVKSLARFIEGYTDLYLASTNSPFIVLLKPSDNRKFTNLIKGNSNLQASIEWKLETDKEGNKSTKWYLYPFSNDTARSESLFLSFKLPYLIEKLILKSKDDKDHLIKAKNSKSQYLNKFIFFVRVPDGEGFFVSISYRDLLPVDRD